MIAIVLFDEHTRHPLDSLRGLTAWVIEFCGGSVHVAIGSFHIWLRVTALWFCPTGGR